jgi:putative transcriptional regulator
MPIRITLDAMLMRRGMKARELAARVGVSETHLSLFRSGKVKGVRFETLAKLCAVLECRPGDLLDFDGGAGVEARDEDAAEGVDAL